MEVTGIILAGGKSSRIGQDKGLLQLGGKTLAEIAIGHLSAVCSEVIISANSPDYQKFGLHIVADIFTDIGPISGLFSAISASKTEVNLILSVDLPFVNAQLLEFLISNIPGYQAVVPSSGVDRLEPLCACYDVSVLPFIEKSIEDRSFKLQHFLGNIRMKPVLMDERLPFWHPHLFDNINSMEDIERARKLAGSGRIFNS